MFLCLMLLLTPERAPKASPATCFHILNYFIYIPKITQNKWQDWLWGPAKGFKITLHMENILKNRIKDGRNSTKIGASNIFGGNQLSRSSNN